MNSIRQSSHDKCLTEHTQKEANQECHAKIKTTLKPYQMFDDLLLKLLSYYFSCL